MLVKAVVAVHFTDGKTEVLNGAKVNRTFIDVVEHVAVEGPINSVALPDVKSRSVAVRAMAENKFRHFHGGIEYGKCYSSIQLYEETK